MKKRTIRYGVWALLGVYYLVTAVFTNHDWWYYLFLLWPVAGFLLTWKLYEMSDRRRRKLEELHAQIVARIRFFPEHGGWAATPAAGPFQYDYLNG